MVLFDEDPVTLIQQTTTNFHTASDLSCLTRISSSLSTLRSARSLRLQSQSHALSQITRTAHQKQQTLDSQTQSHDPSAHATDILALDTDKFRVAKSCSDLEVEGERLEGELRGLKNQLRVVEEAGEEGGGDGEKRGLEDENVLRLSVYRSLGIDAEQDPVTGEVKRAVVRNRERGDVNVVNIDAKFDSFFYANHFWGSL